MSLGTRTGKLNSASVGGEDTSHHASERAKTVARNNKRRDRDMTSPQEETTTVGGKTGEARNALIPGERERRDNLREKTRTRGERRDVTPLASLCFNLQFAICNSG
jgi:hypothetical protein